MDEMVDSREVKPVPDRFLFSMGGYGGDSFEVRWSGAMLVFTHRSARNKILSIEHVAPTEDEWKAFWRWLDEHRCWDWPEVCVNKIDVVDGTHWNLVVEAAGKTLASSGSNAYPDSEDADPSEVFKAFVAEVRQLLGGVEIY